MCINNQAILKQQPRPQTVYRTHLLYSTSWRHRANTCIIDRCSHFKYLGSRHQSCVVSGNTYTTSHLHVKYLSLFLLLVLLTNYSILHVLFSNLCMSTKPQSLIDLFVFNCIRNCWNNHVSDVNSKDPSIQVHRLVPMKKCPNYCSSSLF